VPVPLQFGPADDHERHHQQQLQQQQEAVTAVESETEVHAPC
jgi:hypothetical protein